MSSLVLLPTAVLAAGPDPLAGVPTDATTLLLVNAFVGIVLPLLVQLLARINAQAWVKVVVNLALSAVAAVLVPLTAGDGHINWVAVGLSFSQIFVTSIVTHYGLFKPTGITGDGGAIAMAVPGGIGPAVTDPPVDPAPTAPVAPPVVPPPPASAFTSGGITNGNSGATTVTGPTPTLSPPVAPPTDPTSSTTDGPYIPKH